MLIAFVFWWYIVRSTNALVDAARFSAELTLENLRAQLVEGHDPVLQVDVTRFVRTQVSNRVILFLILHYRFLIRWANFVAWYSCKRTAILCPTATLDIPVRMTTSSMFMQR